MSDRAPVVGHPELLDRILGNIQEGLAENLAWLDKAFGKAERLVKYDNFRKRIYTPCVYDTGNEYREVLPDSGIGNFSFFVVNDPQEVDWLPNVSVGIVATASLIVWFDFRRIFGSPDIRDIEQVKKQILDVLNGGFWLKAGGLKVTRIWERAENIYKGFSLDEVDNQFLMQPYGGLRFDIELKIKETCNL